MRAKRDRQIDVTGSTGFQRLVMDGIGLDIDAVPTPLAEQFGNGVLVGRTGADVDVETALDMTEGAPQHYIFEVLGVGNNGLGRHWG